MSFADKVKEVRMQLNISQEKLAAKLGVSFSTVNRWEKGHSYPSYKAQAQFLEKIVTAQQHSRSKCQ